MSELRFSDGIPKAGFAEAKPGEYKTRTCGECVRCTPNFGGKPGWHCSNIDHREPITPGQGACEIFWDEEAQHRLNEKHTEDIERRRKELWVVYAQKEPITLTFDDDGYGYVPKCPICGEMPYSTTQCHWCGQRFVQDERVEEYNDPGPEVRLDCPRCGGEKTLVGYRARSNGHFHGSCEKCGCMVME